MKRPASLIGNKKKFLIFGCGFSGNFFAKAIKKYLNCDPQKLTLVEQIKYEFSDELVSSDIIGSIAPAIFDSKATQVRNNGKNAIYTFGMAMSMYTANK